MVPMHRRKERNIRHAAIVLVDTTGHFVMVGGSIWQARNGAIDC